MAMEYAGGVVLGADSRTTNGSYIADRVASKITKINDSVYVCRSGSAADTQAIADYVQSESKHLRYRAVSCCPFFDQLI
jgi:20S proteasome subunit beta 1